MYLWTLATEIVIEHLLEHVRLVTSGDFVSVPPNVQVVPAAR